MLARVRNTLRYKLLLLVLLPIFLVLPVVLLLAMHWGQRFGYDQLYHKVNSDLAVAHHAFETFQQSNLQELGKVAESYVFRTSFYEGDTSTLTSLLDNLRRQQNFAFIHITDRYGNCLYESGHPLRTKPSQLTKLAMAGTPSSGIEIFSHDELRNESPVLAQRVRLPLLETPYAKPIDKTQEDRGMMLRVIYPIHDLLVDDVVAVLDAGVLLNGNFHFVDTLRDLVYGPGSLMKGSIGTVTVFLDDVRISTNVPLGKGERALGTRVSQQVRDHVLGRGAKWINRAFVVNDWYISAYEPILDVNGKRVGMLYAGFLEAPFTQEMNRTIQMLLLGFAIVMILSSIWAVKGAKSIFQPVESMAEVVRDTQEGRESRIGEVGSQDELGELARQFDNMLDLIHEREEQIRRAGEELEHKVEERTSELQQKNRDLKQTIHLLKETREQLVMSKKLAALGELTAGIAHELNNPTAVILGNMEVLIDELGEALAPARFEADLIIEQVYRIRSIINSLLQYSRSSEYVGMLNTVDVNQLIKDSLVLVKHSIDRQGVKIRQNLNAHNSISINRQELQQVIINLCVNAVQAMESGGVLTLGTRDWDDRGVVISVQDTGSGIDSRHLERLFDPFFSTKGNDGTGLGLSVSYGFVKRYGGNITVSSEPGRGSLFEVWLLSSPPMDEASQEQAFEALLEQAGRH
jgi:two-component system NtrC family sensor kinase